MTGASERLRIVRLAGGSIEAKVPAGAGWSSPSSRSTASPSRIDVELDLAAAGLVVLGDLAAGRDLDQVEAEGRGAERLARQPPGRLARALHRLELVAVLDRVAAAIETPFGRGFSCDHTRLDPEEKR